MDLEALWSIEFISSLGAFGGGVVVFESNRVFGGDAAYYYVGKYEIKNGTISGRAAVTYYNTAMPQSSIFGPLRQFDVTMEGPLKFPVMELQGSLASNPMMKLSVRLTWREPLP